jgi:hypothetical protein
MRGRERDVDQPNLRGEHFIVRKSGEHVYPGIRCLSAQGYSNPSKLVESTPRDRLEGFQMSMNQCFR